MCITTSIHYTACSHTYFSRTAARCVPSQLSHGKFCEGDGVSAVVVAGECFNCCEPPLPSLDGTDGIDTSAGVTTGMETSSRGSITTDDDRGDAVGEGSSAGNTTDGDDDSTKTSGTSDTVDTECSGKSEGKEGKEKKKERPKPGDCLDDYPDFEFEIEEIQKREFSARGLGRGVGMGNTGEGKRKPRKLQKARKVPGVKKRAGERFVLEEEGEEKSV